jgi:hypothetical protein
MADAKAQALLSFEPTPFGERIRATASRLKTSEPVFWCLG